MKDLSIDRPSAEEAERIMKNMYYSIPESSSGMYSLSELRPMEEVYRDFLKKGDSLIVLRNGSELAGHVHFGPQRGGIVYTKTKGHIYDLYVDKSYRGKGAGRLLLQKAVNELRNSSCVAVTANTYRNGAGWALLKSEEFSETKISFSFSRIYSALNESEFEIFRGVPEDLRTLFNELSCSAESIRSQLSVTASELFFTLNNALDSGGRILICQHEKETVGLLIYSIFEDLMTFSCLGFVEFILVGSRFRKKGIGRGLLSFLSEDLSKNAVRQTFFECVFDSDYHKWSEIVGMQEFSVLLEKSLD
ncbi:MAG: GNAT family N-acetyltransferase [Kosmotogaceae bacterium]|nr:GNAT family N-acetyltransferase [Kosmotogaceae bacterium]